MTDSNHFVLNLTFTKIVSNKTIFPLIIPLILSGFIHVWNPIGFPPIGADEGVYMRRSLHILAGLGPQELKIGYYDHPYFGQLFLAGIFSMIQYPDIVQPALGDRHSIEMLYTVPRILMGLLAVVDTFLVYKICERRYNRNVALISSILFAVMPITWLLRLILLDVILLPFLLASILFAVYTKDATIKNQYRKNILLTLFSGIFLGLAIFTKASAFTMVPLVGLIIFTNRGSMRWKRLWLWIIPILLIPSIWPAYAIFLGDFDKWADGVVHQATERDRDAFGTLNIFFKIDPVLLVFGFASIGFAAVVKKDFIPIIWVTPLLSFFYLSNFSSLFHYVPLLPAFCIAAGIFVDYLSNKINIIRKAKEEDISSSNQNFIKDLKKINIFNSLLKRPSITIVLGLGIFGTVISFMLVTTNTAAFQFDAMSYVAQRVSNNSNVTIISASQYSWIFEYVFGMENAFGVKEQRKVPTENAIMMIDEDFKNYIADSDEDIKTSEDLNTTANAMDDDLDTVWLNPNPISWILIDLGSEKNICGAKISGFMENEESPGITISISDNGRSFEEVYSGNMYTSSNIFNKYDISDVAARYLKINLLGRTEISEIDVYGNTGKVPDAFNDSCKNLQVVNFSSPISATDIFHAFNTHRSGILYKETLSTLYNVYPQLAKFVGSAEKYDIGKYPYTSMGYYRSGSSIEIRAN
ncbi:MAG TPA: discoidin domain-containing protein [Nitrososphaeraceae archaeon]|nr:discoidin domain-containing protein [Nitrososphaeraceae archaeon]